MPLYVVNLDIDFVVKANSEEEAIKLAARQIEDIVRNDVTDEEFTVTKRIKSISDLPFGWNSLNCMPWGQSVRPSYSIKDEINSETIAEDE